MSSPTEPGASTHAEPIDHAARNAQILEQFAAVPSPAKAWCLPGAKDLPGPGPQLLVQWNQRDLTADKQRTSISTVHVESRSVGGFPWELQGVDAVVPSPSGKAVLLVKNSGRAAPGGAAGEGVLLELWGGGRLLKEVCVPKTLHGAVYADGWFEGVAWSPDELNIVYVAEQPRKDPTPKWCSGGAPQTEGGADSAGVGGATGGAGGGGGVTALGPGWTGQGEWQEDWGEAFTGKATSGIFRLHVPSGQVGAVPGAPSGVSLGQVVWAPMGDGVVFAGWSDHSPNFRISKKLGMIYCFNRPCALYWLPVALPEDDHPEDFRLLRSSGPALEEAEAVRLTDPAGSASSPRFTPDGGLLVFLSHQTAVLTGVHNATAALCSLPWVAEEGGAAAAAHAAEAPPRLVLPVPAHYRGADGEFPGLYTARLAADPWLEVRDPADPGGGGVHLAVQTTWRSDEAIVAVDLDSGGVARITPSSSHLAEAGADSAWAANGGSWTLLTAGPVLCAAHSTPTSPPRVMVHDGGFPSWRIAPAAGPGEVAQHEQLAWEAVRSAGAEAVPAQVAAALEAASFRVLPVPAPDGGPPFDAILLQAAGPAEGGGGAAEQWGGAQPTCVVPHGGPHASCSTSWVMSCAFLCSIGCNVLQVNYRGSTGFGEAALQSLPGNIGTQDVRDMVAAVDAAVGTGAVDPAAVALVGGSHGGFLTAHLLGQFPGRFFTGILRNPVCNLSAMVGMTDIPDWCFVEAFGTRSSEGLRAFSPTPSPRDLQRLYDVSPISHAGKVAAPTLFFIGARDRRVPKEDGLQYVHALRSRGLKASVIVFPEDNHALSKPRTEFEQWVTTASWLAQHLPASASSRADGE